MKKLFMKNPLGWMCFTGAVLLLIATLMITFIPQILGFWLSLGFIGFTLFATCGIALLKDIFEE